MSLNISFPNLASAKLENGPSVPAQEKDFHSFSNPEQIRVRHIDLDLTVLFEEKTLHGVAALSFIRLDATSHLTVDTMRLKILKVEVSAEGSTYSPASSSLDEAHPILASPLTIEL